MLLTNVLVVNSHSFQGDLWGTSPSRMFCYPAYAITEIAGKGQPWKRGGKFPKLYTYLCAGKGFSPVKLAVHITVNPLGSFMHTLDACILFPAFVMLTTGCPEHQTCVMRWSVWRKYKKDCTYIYTAWPAFCGRMKQSLFIFFCSFPIRARKCHFYSFFLLLTYTLFPTKDTMNTCHLLPLMLPFI